MKFSEEPGYRYSRPARPTGVSILTILNGFSAGIMPALAAITQIANAANQNGEGLSLAALCLSVGLPVTIVSAAIGAFLGSDRARLAMLFLVTLFFSLRAFQNASLARAGGTIAAFMAFARIPADITLLETGMGGAIAVLSAQVDDMTVALEKARGAANGSAESLEDLTARGEAVAKRLELLVASLHDLPEPAAKPLNTPVEGPPEGERRLRFVRRRASRDTLEAAE